MTPVRVQVQTYHGRQDGFRYGEVHFEDGDIRHYLLDRLNRTVRLWGGVKIGNQPDERPEHVAAALQALAAIEPFP